MYKIFLPNILPPIRRRPTIFFKWEDGKQRSFIERIFFSFQQYALTYVYKEPCRDMVSQKKSKFQFHFKRITQIISEQFGLLCRLCVREFQWEVRKRLPQNNLRFYQIYTRCNRQNFSVA